MTAISLPEYLSLAPHPLDFEMMNKEEGGLTRL
jgi:hypothetical protein